jgi:hypothetical protein
MLKTCAENTMSAARITGILLVALAAGCAGLKEEAPPSVTAQSEAKRETTIAFAPPPAGPHQPAKTVMTENEILGLEPVAGARMPPPSKSGSAARVAPSPVKAPAKVSAVPLAIGQPQKNEDPPPVASKLEPPLDVAALTARLRETNAIGVFTKLALKNQVDDLLKQFQAYHEGGQKTSIAPLRQPYDMLVLKVLSVVQDKDPSLARTIAGSREAIWGILADPEKFKSVA